MVRCIGMLLRQLLHSQLRTQLTALYTFKYYVFCTPRWHMLQLIHVIILCAFMSWRADMLLSLLPLLVNLKP